MRDTRRYGRATPLAVYAVLALGIGVAAWLYLHGFQRDLQARVERELSTIADVKVGQLVAWREAQQREWTEFRAGRLVNPALRRATEGLARDREERRILLDVLRSKQERQGAVAVLLLDGQGRPVAAIPDDARPTPAELELVERALGTPEALLDEGEPGDDLAVAVAVDAAAPEDGALLVRYDMARSVSRMVLDWPHPSSSAEPVLVRRAGDYIVPVTTPRHTKAPRLPLSMDIPTTRAVKGVTGIVECDDYRGVPVIAALRRVPGSSWHLSVKVDRAEVFAPGRQQALTFGVVTLALLTFAGAVVWFWWRAETSAMDRREEELERQALRSRFDALWSQANDIVVVFEPGGRVLDANQRALEAYGYPREELVGLPVAELRAPEARAELPSQLGRVIAEGALRFETVHRRRDGRTFPVEVSTARVGTSAGPLIVSVIRDIGDREAAAAAARYQATLLENLNDAVIGLDRSARVTAWAGAATRLYGYSAEEALGRPIAALLGGDLPEETDRRIREELALTGRCRTEVRHAGKDGQPVDVEVTSVAIRDGQGEVTGYVVVHRDLRDRKRAEAEQRRLQSELVFADRLASIGTLAAGVAHEINNPLAFLLANLDYLAQQRAGAPGQDPAWAEALREAGDGARRIAEIVRGLKAFGRRDGESLPGPVDVRKAATAAAHMVKALARSRTRLVLDLAETPPVLGKEHELAQIVLNLVINAVQAIPEGAPADNEVHIATRRGTDGAVELTVRDTGVGIAPEHLDRIYDPFFTTKEVGEGSGLGLSICMGLVRGMDGTIEVDSVVGRGTTFTIRLPAAPTAPEQPAGGARRGGRGGRVLVLDDEAMVCAAVRRSLEPEHQVETVTDPHAAVERLAAGEPYDVVVCDLLMPRMTGMECFEELSRRRPEAARRMVFLTGGGFSPRARQFIEAHRARCIEKPFEPAELRARIAEAVERLGEA